MLLKFLIFSVTLISAYSEQVRFDNHALYKIHPENEEQVKFLKKFEDELEGLDFWKRVSRAGDYASVVVPPEIKKKFEHLLKKRSIRSELMQENIQE